jgi:hypothetical protein
MRNVFVMFVFLSAVACVTTMGDEFDTARVNDIIPCITTEEELRNLFGEPTGRGNQNGLRTLRWTHVKVTAMPLGMGSRSEADDLLVMLSRDGKVSQYALNPTWEMRPLDSCATNP